MVLRKRGVPGVPGGAAVGQVLAVAGADVRGYGIAVWRQSPGGWGGGRSASARPSRGDSEAWRSGQISPGRAGGRAGQPLVAVGVGAVFAVEPEEAAGGDPPVVEVTGDGVVAQAGGGGGQRPGQGGTEPAALDQQRSPVFAWMPSWSIR